MGRIADDLDFDKVVKSLVIDDQSKRSEAAKEQEFSNSYNLSDLGKEINEAAI